MYEHPRAGHFAGIDERPKRTQIHPHTPYKDIDLQLLKVDVDRHLNDPTNVPLHLGPDMDFYATSIKRGWLSRVAIGECLPIASVTEVEIWRRLPMQSFIERLFDMESTVDLRLNVTPPAGSGE